MELQTLIILVAVKKGERQAKKLSFHRSQHEKPQQMG